jgi:pSer/pThr/pTyr-binding forkhead associated (FHA) protein
MGAALKFKHADIPRQAQELARLKIVNGPDVGAVFVVTSQKVTLGRGEDNDIVLADLKTSRRHAEISWGGNQWNVKDLGSANGIVYNGKPTRAAVLKTADIVTLGDTTIEFLMADAGTQMLRAVPRSIGEISQEQKAFSTQQQKVRELGVVGGPKRRAGAPIAAGASAGKNPKVLIYVALVGAVAYVLYGTPEAPPAKKVTPPPLSSYLPSVESTDSSVNKTADQFFHEGFREYRQKNYLRAKVQFETALQVEPGHQLAMLYLENCNNMIDDEVKYHIDNGKKNLDAGKLKEAKNDYESVMRLKFRNQTDPAYKEAEEQLKEVNKEIEQVRSP